MRTPSKKVVSKIVTILRKERPDYNYLRDIFKQVRAELNVEVTKQPKHLPYVPTEEDLKKYYEVVWQARDIKHILIIKVLLYTGARVNELIHIKLMDIDFDRCQIRINEGKGQKDRIVPFPSSFRESLMVYAENEQSHGSIYLFESNRKSIYSTRGIRKILAKYATLAGLEESLSPHKLRHFLFTWLKKQGIDDALIQPYSGHSTRQSLEVYSKLSLTEAQETYEEAIKKFPIH